jgi:cyclopropane-fatty-acyl-phospholipid synthase
MTPTRTRSSRPRRTLRALVFRKLEQISHGRLILVDREGEHRFGDPSSELQATLHIHDTRFYRAAALGGDVAVADAYLDGWWSADDLVAFFRIIIQNTTLLTQTSSGWARLGDLVSRAVHAVHRNTRSGSRKNISAHYDLGNELFSSFLDQTMMYSCAIFPTETSTLEEASHYKNDRICRKLDLGPGDHLLEIGTGWGGFAVHAAANYGCRVTTTTISKEQYGFAADRIREAGLEDRITLLRKDYRDLEGVYDKLVSIEMIEAVGHHYYDDYFGMCSRLLKPEGLMLLQAITISDWAYDRHKNAVDFIKSHIFPGSCIPSVTTISVSIARETDMRTVHLEDIGPHYVRTLQAWRARFTESRDRLTALGYDERFVRGWQYYLTYCEAGFEERYISDAHLVFAKPRNRRAPILPGIRNTAERRPLEATDAV